MDKERIARKNLLRSGKESNGIAVKGYDFNNGVDYPEIVKSYACMGFQATHLSRAIDITNEMIKEKAFIFWVILQIWFLLLRDIFRWLVEHKSKCSRDNDWRY